MANISTYLQKIMDAVYGEEVRGSIYNALVAMNAESTNAMQYASTARDSAQASATEAASSATTAGQKATAAANSASVAAVSEAQAKISEQNAATSAFDASDAATRAATSEQNAANSEALARQKAQEADTSKSAAALSAANAAASEAAAQTYRNQAETFAGQALTDKNAADAAKAGAEAAQLAAENARDAARTSEQNAKASETTVLSAQGIAVQAKTDAEAANAAAQQAKDDAEDAKDDAEAAADAAADSASNAAASALSAQQYSGKPARPDPTTKTWWIWNSMTQQYEDSGIGSDIEGPQGVGISDIQLTSGDHTPGTTDIYTVYLTNGGTYNISVWNGRNGEGAGDVLGKSFELLIPAAGWSDGRITVADNRLIALSTHKYFITADEASREEYLNCEVRALDITSDGFITFVNSTDPIEDLNVSVLRFELSANG